MQVFVQNTAAQIGNDEIVLQFLDSQSIRSAQSVGRQDKSGRIVLKTGNEELRIAD